MDQRTETPKRVTPTEARAKLLRSLIASPKDKDREKRDEAMANFIQEMIRQDEPTSGQ